MGLKHDNYMKASVGDYKTEAVSTRIAPPRPAQLIFFDRWAFSAFFTPSDRPLWYEK